MKRPFWTTGAVPTGLLSELALPRTDALAATVATLREGRVARIGGPPGNGRTTLALQAAAALDRPAILMDSSEHRSGAEARSAIIEALWTGRRRPKDDWDAIATVLEESGDPVLILDGGPGSVATDIASALRRSMVIHVGTEGAVPDALRGSDAKAFLQRRANKAGATFTTESLQQAADLAQGQPDALQWIGHNALAYAQALGKVHVELDDVLEGASVAAEHLPASHMSRLARLQGAQSRLLKAMVRRPDAGPSAWGEMGGVPQNAVSVHLKRLVEAGLVEKHGRGAYAVRSPLLRLHVQGRSGTVAQLVRPA